MIKISLNRTYGIVLIMIPLFFSQNLFANFSFSIGADTVLCKGNKIVLEPDFIPDNATFIWSTGETTSSIELFPNNTATYSLTITSGDDTFNDEILVQVSNLNIQLISSPTLPCKEIGSIKVQATDYIGSLNYNWSTGVNTQIASDLSLGIYTVTVNDDACKISGSVKVNINGSEPFLELGADIVSCDLESYTLVSPIKGETYEWSNGANTEKTTVFESGKYYLNVTTKEGCFLSDTINITFSNLEDLDIPTDLSNCSSFEYTLDTDYTVTWDEGTKGNSIFFTESRTYELTVENNYGCSQNYEINVSVDTDLSSDVYYSKNPSCQGDPTGWILIEPQNGVAPYTFEWSHGADSDLINRLTSGQYECTVTDALGCTEIITRNIGNINLSVSLESINSCAHDGGKISAVAKGDNPPFNFHWSNTQFSESIENLTSGDYSVTVTDKEGCVVTKSVKIDNYPNLGLESEIDHVSCKNFRNGRISLNPTKGKAPFTITWEGAQSNEFSLVDLKKGIYTAFISDSENCSIAKSFEIQEPNFLEATRVLKEGPEQYYYQAIPSGGTAPYEIEWMDGTIGAIYMNPDLSTDTYFSIVDANGCDYFWTKPFSTGINQTEFENLVIYPNPNFGNFTIDNISKSTYQINLLNSLGQIISTKHIDNQSKIQWMNSNIIHGTYFLELLSETGKTVKKIVIQ